MQHIASRLDPLTTLGLRCSATTKWRCNTPQHTAPHYNALHETTRHHNNTVLACRVKHVAALSLIADATLCNTQHHTATLYNALQRSAAHNKT